MSAKVVSVAPDIGVREAFFTIREHGIRHLPVVEPDGRLAGIVGERGLRRSDRVEEARDLAHVYHLDDDILVRDMMIGQVRVVHADDTLRAAARELFDHHVGVVPVLDKTESLVGVLSVVDLLRALSDVIDQR